MISITNSEAGGLKSQQETTNSILGDKSSGKFLPTTTPGSPKSVQTPSMPFPKSKEDITKPSTSPQSSINSASLSQTSSDMGSNNDTSHELSISYLNELSNKAKIILETNQIEDANTKEVFQSLQEALRKVRSDSNSYRIKAELLSISSKDADMRYEVENEIIKREVERLKNKGSSVDYLMNKINHQKHTLKKYKNEIIEKNKEIIYLRSLIQNSGPETSPIRPVVTKSEETRTSYYLANTDARELFKKRKTLGTRK